MNLKKILIKGAIEIARKSEWFRKTIKDSLVNNLREKYESTTKDEETLNYQKVFGLSVLPFLERLLLEKPKATMKIVDFAFQWGDDMEKRDTFRKQGLMAPATYVAEPTRKCNLNCPGCYAASENHGPSLDYQILERIDDEMKQIGVTLTTISGGEPFIAERKERAITRLAEHALNQGNNGAFLVYTNGTLIDEEIAKRIGDLGNIWPAISIEGFKESTRKRRGENIIDKIKKAKENLNKFGVMYGFSVTATQKNANEIATDDFFEQRLEEGDSFGWVFIYQPIGRSVNADLMVTGEQRYNIGKKVLEKQIEQKTPLFLGDFWNYGPFVEGCIAAGKYYFHIMSNGTISPCVFSPFGVANLNEIESFKDFYPDTEKKFKNLQDMITNQETFRFYRQQQDKIRDRSRPCVLIDHPNLARETFSSCHCFETNNTPKDYFKGRTAHIIDERAREWQDIWAPKLKEYTENLIKKKLEKRLTEPILV